MAEHKTFCRTLYENCLAGDKCKYIVTVDKAWVYLNGCNKKGLFMIKIEEKKHVLAYFHQCEESVLKSHEKS